MKKKKNQLECKWMLFYKFFSPNVHEKCREKDCTRKTEMWKNCYLGGQKTWIRENQAKGQEISKEIVVSSNTPKKPNIVFPDFFPNAL